MSRRTTQFIYSLFGINQNPPTTPPAATIPTIHGAKNANHKFLNPLNDSAIATKLLQVNNNSTIATPDQFDKKRRFKIFVPSGFATAFLNAPAGSKPRAKVSLFYGVGVELNLFRLRDFFASEINSVIITISGVETESTNPPVAGDSWGGIHIAFGYGISKQIIIDLFKKAGLDPVDFDVEVIAGYSTGYRGVNLTVINELVDLSKLKRLVYLDAWYHHNDHPLMPTGSPYRAKNTLFAVDTALTKSPAAQLIIYAYTPGGVPRSNPGQTNPALPSATKEPIASLITKYPGRVNFIDFNFKFGTRPAIETQLEKICLARLIQFGTGNQFPAADIDASLVPLITALPVRGSFGTFGLAGYTDLYSWINTHQTEINGFDFTKANAMVLNFQLLDDWTDSRRGEMRHRTFVIELGKEPLVP